MPTVDNLYALSGLFQGPIDAIVTYIHDLHFYTATS